MKIYAVVFILGSTWLFRNSFSEDSTMPVSFSRYSLFDSSRVDPNSLLRAPPCIGVKYVD